MTFTLDNFLRALSLACLIVGAIIGYVVAKCSTPAPAIAPVATVVTPAVTSKPKPSTLAERYNSWLDEGRKLRDDAEAGAVGNEFANHLRTAKIHRLRRDELGPPNLDEDVWGMVRELERDASTDERRYIDHSIMKAKLEACIGQ